MKKTLLIFAAMTFLVACNKELFDIAQPVPVETNGIKISLSVTRHDSFGSTKATVKSEWADDDVIFVFFKGVTAPKYLEMKYDSGSDTWTPMAKNGLTSSDLSDAADKKMTAVYLPYGSTATVAASEGNFIFSDFTYSGYFLKAELVTYTYDGDVLSGTLNMTAPELSSGSDKLIHFDISGFTSGHDYKLYQDYVKPLTFTSVSAAGIICTNEGTMGSAITGYEDGSMMSFSGILDASAVGNAVDYQFSIDDLTSSILYTRDAGTKTVSLSKYIGIGAINNAEVWKSFEYVDLGLSVRWATYNVGAAQPEDFGDQYAWGETEPKTSYDWSSYKWCNGTSNTLTKYNTSDIYGMVDNKTILDIEDDVAHVRWGGSWRMPTKAEQDELRNNCSWTWTSVNGVDGCIVTSNIPGYTERSIFLPICGPGYLYGFLWSSSIRYDAPTYAYGLTFNSGEVISQANTYPSTRNVRPVSPSDSWLSSVSINMLEDEKTVIVDGSLVLSVIVKRIDEEIEGPIVWSSDNPSVAVVYEDGKVIGKSPGTAHIKASIQTLFTQCTVTVTEESEIEHEYVDLGLSVKWATFNVGATKPEEYGNYYSWGEINIKPRYTNWSLYKWCNGSSNTLTKYNTSDIYGTVDNKTILDIEDDVAHVRWGGSWRMPTKAEQDELRDNCNWTWTTINGVNGYLVTSNVPGFTEQSIFLPAAGYYAIAHNGLGSSGEYLSSSLYEEDPSSAYCLDFYSGYVGYAAGGRYNGKSVRPVCP